ncbi:MAG: translocation/assembly module TamB domain-containing protein [Candidatus Eremiobacteraeota bacterium]|nr:translocation/assembly module TamB domain-containing protein [Candidatus Eremiobacteraeota bacterium]
MQILGRSQLDMNWSVYDLDLGLWLPALGYTPPLLGHVVASGAIHGRYPGLALNVDGEMVGGVVGRIPIDRLRVALNASGSRTEIRAAELAFADLSLQASGSFGFSARDPLLMNVRAHSDHFGNFLDRVFDKSYGLDGVLDATVALGGTLLNPRADGGLELGTLRFGGLTIPSLVASFGLDEKGLALRDATAYLSAGKVTLAGSLPLLVSPFGIGPPKAPLQFDLGVQAVALDQFASVLPAGSKLAGNLDGLVGVRGTVAAPRLIGGLDLQGGGYTGPLETEPITAFNGSLAFDGSSVQLTRFEGNLGGGRVAGSGALTLPDLRTLSRPVYDFELALGGIRAGVPGYGSARADGRLSLRRAAGAKMGTLAGNVAISDAAIPLGAFLKSGGPAPTSQFSIAPALGQPSQRSALAAGLFAIPGWLGGLGFDLTVSAGNNVRIRSPILDIGGNGTVAIGGTVAAPTLRGSFQANPGGTLFLNRPFRIQEALVRFSPANGIAPALLARATTTVQSRQIAAPIDVTVTAAGVVPDIKLSYASNPPYDEATIVGLLFDASALGASVGSLNALAPTTNILLPPNAFQSTPGGTLALSQEAANLINAQFTARLLAPIEQGLGSAFGLSDLALNVGPTGSFGVQARHLVGRNSSLLYGTSLTYPYRITFGVESRPNPQTSIIFTGFTQQGQYLLGGVKPDAYLSTNPKLGSAADLGGTHGFTLNIQRLFR